MAVDLLNPDNRLRGPLVVKLGGGAVDAENPALFAALAQLVLASEEGVVIVHGGGTAVDSQLRRVGAVTERRDGIRITPPELIDDVVGVLAGAVNKRLVGHLRLAGANAVGLCLGDGGVVEMTRSRRYPFDAGCVGEVTGGCDTLIKLLLGGGFLPVVCSIGLDPHGKPLNVNADEAAAGLAAVLGASGLVLLTDVPGILDEHGRLIETIDAAGVEARIAAGLITGGMIAKTLSALEASASSGVPVIITSWKATATLALLAHDSAVGTRLLPASEAAGRPSCHSFRPLPTEAPST